MVQIKFDAHNKHKKNNANLTYDTEGGHRGCRKKESSNGRSEPSHQRWTKNNARYHFTHDWWLAQATKDCGKEFGNDDNGDYLEEKNR